MFYEFLVAASPYVAGALWGVLLQVMYTMTLTSWPVLIYAATVGVLYGIISALHWSEQLNAPAKEVVFAGLMGAVVPALARNCAILRHFWIFLGIPTATTLGLVTWPFLYPSWNGYVDIRNQHTLLLFHSATCLHATNLELLSGYVSAWATLIGVVLQLAVTLYHFLGFQPGEDELEPPFYGLFEDNPDGRVPSQGIRLAFLSVGSVNLLVNLVRCCYLFEEKKAPQIDTWWASSYCAVVAFILLFSLVFRKAISKNFKKKVSELAWKSTLANLVMAAIHSIQTRAVILDSPGLITLALCFVRWLN